MTPPEDESRVPKWGSSWRLLLAAILLLAIVLRIAFSLGISRGVLHEEPQALSNDEYHLIAGNLLSGNGYRLRVGQPLTVERPPAYPAFLLLIFGVAGVNYVWVQIAQAFLGAISCWLLFLLGRWVLSTELGIAAALLYALYPNSIEYSARLYSENLYFPVFLWFAYSLCRASREASAWKGGAAGVAWGLSLLTRGTLLPLPLVLPFGIALSRIHRSPSRWLRWAIPALTAGLLVVAPWSARNYSLTGAVVPVSSVAWAGFYQGMQVAKQMATWKNLIQVDADAAHHINEVAGERFPRRSPPATGDSVRRDQVAREMTLEEWKDDPLGVVKRAVAGMGFAWFFVFGAKLRVLSFMVHFPLLVLFVLGVVQMARVSPAAFGRAWPALCIILFVNAFYAVAYPHVRYMAPAIALSFLFSGIPLVRLWCHFSRRSGQLPSAGSAYD